MMPLGCLPGEVILVYTVLYFWEGNQRQTLNSMKKLDFSTGLGTPLDPGETGESGWGEESLDFPAASAGSMTLTWISNWRWDRKRQDEIHKVNFGFTWSQRYDEQTEQSAHWWHRLWSRCFEEMKPDVVCFTWLLGWDSAIFKDFRTQPNLLPPCSEIIQTEIDLDMWRMLKVWTLEVMAATTTSFKFHTETEAQIYDSLSGVWGARGELSRLLCHFM